MPIDESALKRNFRVFDPQTTLEQVFAQVGTEEELYIVVGLASGQYASTSLSELRKDAECPFGRPARTVRGRSGRTGQHEHEPSHSLT